jgi:hypothetical protein
LTICAPPIMSRLTPIIQNQLSLFIRCNNCHFSRITGIIVLHLIEIKVRSFCCTTRSSRAHRPSLTGLKLPKDGQTCYKAIEKRPMHRNAKPVAKAETPAETIGFHSGTQHLGDHGLSNCCCTFRTCRGGLGRAKRRPGFANASNYRSRLIRVTASKKPFFRCK